MKGKLFGGNSFGAAPAAPQAAPMSGGMFPGLGAQDRYDMAMGLIQNAMSSAGNTGSPLAAFLTPILGTMVGAKATQNRDMGRAAEVSRMTETLIGPGGLPSGARRAAEVMENPNAPDYLQTIAGSMFKDALAGQTQASAPGVTRGKSSGGGGAKQPRLTYISRDPDGVYRGYNPVTGKREVVPNADAPTATATATATADDPLGLRAAPSNNDPLGIR